MSSDGGAHYRFGPRERGLARWRGGGPGRS